MEESRKYWGDKYEEDKESEQKAMENMMYKI